MVLDSHTTKNTAKGDKMKILKTSSGKKKIILSKKEWENIGKTAGWISKFADSSANDVAQFLVDQSYKHRHPDVNEDNLAGHLISEALSYTDDLHTSWDENIHIINMNILPNLKNGLYLAEKVGTEITKEIVKICNESMQQFINVNNEIKNANSIDNQSEIEKKWDEEEVPESQREKLILDQISEENKKIKDSLYRLQQSLTALLNQQEIYQ